MPRATRHATIDWSLCTRWLTHAVPQPADRTVGLGQRLDIAFSLIRIGFFHGDIDLVVRNIDKAKSLLEGGGDWDRRNKLKVRWRTHATELDAAAETATLTRECSRSLAPSLS